MCCMVEISVASRLFKLRPLGISSAFNAVDLSVCGYLVKHNENYISVQVVLYFTSVPRG